MATTRKGPGAALAGESYLIPDGLFDDLRDSANWNVTIARLVDVLKIPDLTTRHGLKKVHARFSDIYKKLNASYSAAKRENNERVMGAVVGIMAKMCADALLRDRLFEKGFLTKIMPLLELDSTRYLALNALTMVTHHGGIEARQEIARQNRTLIRLFQDYPDDLQIADGVIATLTHATAAVVGSEDTPPRVLLKEAAIQSVLETVVAILRKPRTTHTILSHALDLLVCAPQHCPNECKAVPGLVALITAFTRSNSINTRAQGIGGLLRLTIQESEFDAQFILPHKLMQAAMQAPPDHLTDLLFDYGTQRLDYYVMQKSMSEYTMAMMNVSRDRDLYALGKKLAFLIQQAEYVIAEGGFRASDGYVLGERDGVPFARWTDALPPAAKALRDRGGKADLDDADVVELKFYIIRQRLPEAIALAHTVIKRNPRLSYAYYTLSLGVDTEEGLRAVKKGLKCPNATPFIRNQLLWRAVSHAGERGLQILQDAREGDMDARAEGSAFLMSAWEDTKTEDLKELDPARRKIKTSIDLMNFVGHSINRTQLNLTRELLLTNYTPGVREWGAVVKCYDEFNSCDDHAAAPRSPAHADDDLAEWLGNVELGDDDAEGNCHAHGATCHGHHRGAARRRGDAPSAETANYELYRCSWCGNPSAILRRCGGCGKTRYCDGACQKSHWSEHKAGCKGR
ncbi:hypothetical protein C8Q80DRAFT_1173343 [Daedaleopsis nitida]|nr:hypothetical protein C8Q80DRAFT_1173343 [Daedaleopsis nitida]